MSNAFVFDVTQETFQRDVVDRSMKVPVLLDFWAEWCEPCRVLGPLLEQLTETYGGSFYLGKVDTESEPEIAQSFQVQGIPFCVLLALGRPTDGFQGALRETELKRFLQRNSIGPAKPIDSVLADPEHKVVDPNSPAGRLTAAISASRVGDADAARTLLADFPEDDPRADRARRLLEALPFLDATLAATGTGAEQLLARARLLLMQGDVEAAMEQVLGSVAEDKSFRQGLARKGMLLCFQFLAENDERIDAFRRRLATLLY